MTTHSLSALAGVSLCLLFGAVGVSQEAATERSDPATGKPDVDVTRADLAVSYLRLEEILAEYPLQADEVAAINQQFDAATFSFFARKYGEALSAIDAISIARLPSDQRNPLATSLKARGIPAVYDLKSGEPPKIRVDSIYEVQNPGGVARLTIAAVDESGNAVATGNVEVDGKPIHADVVLEPTARLEPGSYRLQVLSPGKRNTDIGHWVVAEGSLAEVRARFEDRLDSIKADDPVLKQAVASTKARVALLSDTPSETNSAQFLANPTVLIDSIEEEIRRLASGENPYEGREGDYWRMIEADGQEVPMRIYQPAANRDRAKIPVVFVLHGAGGDENMFMDGYGAGLIKDLADDKQFLVVSPRTERISRPGAFETALNVLQNDYDVDPQRVYVLGHSMGGGATSSIASRHADVVAAAVCLAGGRLSGSLDALAPTLLVAGEIDPVVPAARLEPGAKEARDAGLPVEYKLLSDYGHTLMVAHELPGAIDWLLSHQRD